MKAILADLDGVVVDSLAVHERIWSRWARSKGLDPAHVVHAAHGRPAVYAVALLAPEADAEIEGAALEAEQVRETDGIVALPGAAELLVRDRVAVVTSCTRALAHARLEAAGLPIPPVLVTVDRVARGKPDPEAYLLAARELGADPAECIVIEDAPAGVAAGRAAGMTVLGVLTTHDARDLADAHALVRDLSGLPANLRDEVGDRADDA